jgi:hypothetical protein
VAEVLGLLAITAGSMGIALLLPGLPDDLRNFLLGLAAGAAIPLAQKLFLSLGYLRLATRLASKRNTLVRVSISYLYRIELNGSYLLIKGRRFPEQYQPVGGVYKIAPSGKSFLRQLGALDDTLVPIDHTSRGDLRNRVPATKVLSLIRWFDSGRDRETGPWREFQEELLASGLVDPTDFPYLVHAYIRRHIEPLRWSDYAQSYELLIADIFELIPQGRQSDALSQAALRHPDKLRCVSAEQILRRGAVPGQNFESPIAATAAWTL